MCKNSLEGKMISPAHFLTRRCDFILVLLCFYSVTGHQSESNEISSATSRDGYQRTRPNIVIIVADDLGWNDLSFHGSDQIPTPNIDALAYGGIILNSHYVLPICSPSRSALMTGKHPIHTGLQHNTIDGATPYGLPLKEKLLPQYLKDLGYSTHLVGKWHLGFFRKEYTPTFRGFDSHFGYWTGHQDYFDHTAEEGNGKQIDWGYDFRRDMNVSREQLGKYTTDIFTDESIKIIENHDPNKPLFLVLTHLAVHSGNTYAPLQAPFDEVMKFEYIKDAGRRTFAAMVSKLDESVGRVTKSLADSGLLTNSIILFTTDNGGPAAGFNANAASNWPLRGVKNTYWDGGLRGVAFIWSSLFKQHSFVYNHRLTIYDWLPTLYTAAGGMSSELPSDVNGFDAWEALKNNRSSARTEVLHNIDDVYRVSAMRHGKWKIIQGMTYNSKWDDWYGPSGRPTPSQPQPAYNLSAIREGLSGNALESVGFPIPDDQQILQIREDAEINCGKTYKSMNPESPCRPIEAPCLFDISKDPCELNNLAKSMPALVNALKERIKVINSTAAPMANKPWDPKGNPLYFDYAWTNWLDYGEGLDKREEPLSVSLL